MRVKLLWRAAVPATAKEKHNRRPLIRVLVTFGIKHVEKELCVIYLLVLMHFCTLKLHHLCRNRKREAQGQRLE